MSLETAYNRCGQVPGPVTRRVDGAPRSWIVHLLASFWPDGSLSILWMISAEGLTGKLLARRESMHPIDDWCCRAYPQAFDQKGVWEYCG